MKVAAETFANMMAMNTSSEEEMAATQGNPKDPMISDDTAKIIIVVFQVALAEILAVGCILTNSINIIVFVKMGLTDAVNISLLGLAIGDLMAQVFSLWDSICFNPLIDKTDIPVVFTEIDYITGCWPHTCFVRVTSYITVFVTLERCLCITFPLQVKMMITPRRVRWVIILLYAFVVVTSAPEYYVNQLVWKFVPEKNRTMLGIHFIDDREKFENITMVVNNVVLQCVSLVLVVVCTVVLVVQLNRKAKWRQQAVKRDNTSFEKDKRVIKMISFISTIFIICNIPSCLSFIAMKTSTRFHPTGVNHKMFYVIWSIVYVIEGINSFVNMFVYLKMSSKFRAAFYKLFLIRQEVTTVLSQN